MGTDFDPRLTRLSQLEGLGWWTLDFWVSERFFYFQSCGPGRICMFPILLDKTPQSSLQWSVRLSYSFRQGAGLVTVFRALKYFYCNTWIKQMSYKERNTLRNCAAFRRTAYWPPCVCIDGHRLVVQATADALFTTAVVNWFLVSLFTTILFWGI